MRLRGLSIQSLLTGIMPPTSDLTQPRPLLASSMTFPVRRGSRILEQANCW